MQRVYNRLNLLFHRPTGNRLPARAASLDFVEKNLGVAVEGFVRTDGIDEPEDVFAILVLEIIVDAFLFHETADEIEVRFTVLNAIFPRLVGSRKVEFIVAKPPGIEDILDDVRNAHVLENVAFRGAG